MSQPHDRESIARAVPVNSAPRAQAGVPVEVDPNHHLWKNGRLWWIAFTVHRGHRQERVRFSLLTADVLEARRRRDTVLAIYAAAGDCELRVRLRPRPTAEPEVA